jgi:hypothetical protein
MFGKRFSKLIGASFVGVASLTFVASVLGGSAGASVVPKTAPATFQWRVAGGDPFVAGGVPTKSAYVKDVTSTRAATVMSGMGLNATEIDAVQSDVNTAYACTLKTGTSAIGTSLHSTGTQFIKGVKYVGPNTPAWCETVTLTSKPVVHKYAKKVTNIVTVGNTTTTSYSQKTATSGTITVVHLVVPFKCGNITPISIDVTPSNHSSTKKTQTVVSTPLPVPAPSPPVTTVPTTPTPTIPVVTTPPTTPTCPTGDTGTYPNCVPPVTPTASASCTGLTLSQITGTTQVTATAAYTAQNATLTGMSVNWGSTGTDITPAGSPLSTKTYQYTSAGTYQVSAMLTFSGTNGATSGTTANCTGQITVTPPPPANACVSLSVTQESNSLIVDATSVFTNPNSIKAGPYYNYGDGSLSTTSTQHTYSSAANYTVTVSADYAGDSSPAPSCTYYITVKAPCPSTPPTKPPCQTPPPKCSPPKEQPPCDNNSHGGQSYDSSQGSHGSY